MKMYLYYKGLNFFSVLFYQFISMVINKTEPFTVVPFSFVPENFPGSGLILIGRIDMLQIIISHLLKFFVFICRF